MRKLAYSLLVLLSVVVSACKKHTFGPDDGSDIKVECVTGAATDIYPSTARLSGNVTVSGAKQEGTPVCFYCAKASEGEAALKDASNRNDVPRPQSGQFSVSVIGLSPETEYQYVISVTVDGKAYFGEVKTFTTRQRYTEPVVTGPVLDDSESEVIISGYIDTGDNGGGNGGEDNGGGGSGSGGNNGGGGGNGSGDGSGSGGDNGGGNGGGGGDNDNNGGGGGDNDNNGGGGDNDNNGGGDDDNNSGGNGNGDDDNNGGGGNGNGDDDNNSGGNGNGDDDNNGGGGNGDDDNNGGGGNGDDDNNGGVPGYITDLGVVISQDSHPTLENGLITLRPQRKDVDRNGFFTISLPINQLAPGKYYYVVFIVDQNGIHYGEVKFFIVPGSSANKYTMEFVDLGLSVEWGKWNLGARRESEFGEYFAWGELQPKPYYSIENYTYHDRPSVLPLNRDAANVALGGKCRMATANEWLELLTNCTPSVVTIGGNNGLKLVSNKNGRYIFLPAAGIGADQETLTMPDLPEAGEYFSSTRNDNMHEALLYGLRWTTVEDMGWEYEDPWDRVWTLFFMPDSFDNETVNAVMISNFDHGYCGFTLRPVRGK